MFHFRLGPSRFFLDRAIYEPFGSKMCTTLVLCHELSTRDYLAR